MPYQVQIASQLDLFPSESTELPEWSCSKWQCMNRCSDMSFYEQYSLPSIQYSIPSSIKLTDFTISINMLKDGECTCWIFYYIQKLYNCISAGGGEQALCELHQCLSYVTTAAKDMCINGSLMSASVIARSMERLLISVGTLKDFACTSDSLSTGVIEMNYRFHAILLLWTKAISLFSMVKDSPVGLELFYPPLTTEDSVLSQASILLAYSFIVVARITHIPFVCRCVKAAWEQLCYSLHERLFSTFELLLAICVGPFRCPTLESTTSLMLLDLYEARGTAEAEVFLDVFCALEPKRLCLTKNGRELNDIMCCLNKIIARISDTKFVLRTVVCMHYGKVIKGVFACILCSKISVFIEQLDKEGLKGVDLILQEVFNRLAQLLTDTYSKSFQFIPESGKQWLDYVSLQINSNDVNSDDEWSMFIHLLGKILPRSETAWKSLRSRVFAKFTWKRLREIALTSFTQLVSMFIALAISVDLDEATEKILLLFSNVVDGSEKERICVILRGIHALLELFYRRNLDPSRVINTLVTFMEKLSEKDHVDIYLESYLNICDKGVRIDKLDKFLSNMNDMDVCKILEKTTDLDSVDDAVWNIALCKLDSSFANQAITFLSRQLQKACARNSACAVVMLNSVVKAILVERSIPTQNCFNLLRMLFEDKQLQIDFAVDSIFPIWLLLVMLKLDSEELLHISRCMYNGFRGWFQKRGVSTTDVLHDDSSSLILCKKVLQNFKVLPAEFTGSTRIFLEKCIDSILPLVYTSLSKVDRAVVENTILVVSYLFAYCGWLIFRPPSECSFNRSVFVKISKIFLQNILINREFQESLLEECIPNFFTGLLHLPVTSTPYIQRLISGMICKFGSTYALRQIMLEQLKGHPDVVLALKKGQFKEAILNNFFSFI